MLKKLSALIFLLAVLCLIGPVSNFYCLPLLSDKDKIILSQRVIRSPLVISSRGIKKDKLELIYCFTEASRDPRTGFPELSLKYEAEDMNGDGQTIIDDPEAGNGKARYASPVDKGDNFYLVFGPYETLSAGKYRICFWLKSSAFDREEIIARIDVASQGGRAVLKQRKIRGDELISINKYQPFYLDFYLEKDTGDMEYRVFFTGSAPLWVDHIILEPDFPALIFNI